MSEVQRVALDGLSREELIELVAAEYKIITAYEEIVAEKDRQFDEMCELVDESVRIVERAERVVEKNTVLMEKKDRRIRAAKNRISRLKKSVAARDGKLEREDAARRHVKKRGADPIRDDMPTCKTPKFTIFVDQEFQGLKKALPGADVRVLHKKPKGGNLTPEQKEENKIQSSQQIPIEQGYAGIKRHARFRGPYNGTADELDAELSIAATMHNWNILWDDKLKKVVLDDTRAAKTPKT